jgi:hypothetical protein
MQPAEFFAVARSPRTTVITLRHHDPVASVSSGYRGIDRKYPSVAVSKVSGRIC